MSQIDQLLALIADKKWFSTNKIAQTMEIDNEKLAKMVKLLSEFNFIQVRGQSICIDPDTKKLLKTVSKNQHGKRPPLQDTKSEISV
jgi:predicted transcriptional regulator